MRLPGSQVLVAIACCMLSNLTGDASLCNPLPPEPAPRLFTAEALLDELTRPGMSDRADAVRQLRLLGAPHLSLLEKTLTIVHDDVKRSAIDALAAIGAEPAFAVLRRCVVDTMLSIGIRIAAAEALGDARDASSVSFLEQETARSTSEYFREYVGRAIKRIRSPGCDGSTISLHDGHMAVRFLREDVQRIAVVDLNGQTLHSFAESQIPDVLNLLLQSTPARVSVIQEEQKLLIELRDGRRAEVFIDGSTFFDTDTSHFWHRSAFTVSNEPLRAFIAGAAAAGDAGTGDGP